LHIVDRAGHVVFATGEHDVARDVVLFRNGEWPEDRCAEM